MKKGDFRMKVTSIRARNGGRTRTPFRIQDFKSCASTDSAIRATIDFVPSFSGKVKENITTFAFHLPVGE